jgi:hypothetical protein
MRLSARLHNVCSGSDHSLSACSCLTVYIVWRAGEKRVHNQGMVNALGAWLHCRHADLHVGKDRYASTEPPHELTEKEIRGVLKRISDCDILFTPGQTYVSWAVRPRSRTLASTLLPR